MSATDNDTIRLADRIEQANELLLTRYSGGSGQFKKYDNLNDAERALIVAALRKSPDTSRRPTVIDDDKDAITVGLDGRELRGWSYANDAERRQKMVQAREYVEGWCDGREA